MRKVFMIVIFGIIVGLGWCLRGFDLDRPHGYMFDEIYHVPTFKLIARGDIRAYQWWHSELKEEFPPGAYVEWLHPPLAKLIQAVFFNLGDNRYYIWRLPSAIIGTILIVVVAALARAIFPQQPLTWLLAALLAAIDGLAVAMSRIAMNDIFVTTFSALAILFYWYYYHRPQQTRWLWAMAISVGLACASKWSGFWLFPFIGFWEILRWKIWQTTNKKKAVALVVFTAGIAACVYLTSYGQMFYLGGSLRHFLALHNQIIDYQFYLNATHPYASRAWQWPLGLRPVYLYLDSEQNDRAYWNTPFYPSWYLALGCLVAEILIVIADFYQEVWRRRQTQVASKTVRRFFTDYESQLFLLLGYFALWTPWIFSPRIMYFHHYLPALPCLWVLASGTICKLLDKPIKNDTKINKA
ncbi:phospholipid carrier-dependent glycosyltransferase [bacterium]|nr:phospholipid carrier-dependent glycosyltransferase [bacterium]